MRTARTAIIAAAIVVSAIPARAVDSDPLASGAAYVVKCARAVQAAIGGSGGTNDTIDAGMTGEACIGYVRGVADTLRLAQYLRPGDLGVCIPLDVKPSDLMEVGIKFIVEHPDLADTPPMSGLAAAFRQAWPCKK